MNPTKTIFQRNRLRVAIASAVLMTAHGMANADPVTLNLEMMCPFPLIGDQPILATINADYPAEVTVGESFGPFAVDTITVVNDTSRQGLSLMQAKTVTGEASSFTTISTGHRDIANDVLLTVEPTAVPEESGSFDVPAVGDAPAVVFTVADVGTAQITVDDLILDLINRKADGTPANPPIGEFTSDCTVVEGQNNVLHTFEIVEGDVSVPQNIEVDQTAIDFGDVQMGMTEQMTVAISNSGGEILGINGVSIAGTDADQFVQTNNCTTLAAGENCSVVVTYSASEEGVQNATLTIASDDPDTPNVTVALTGNGLIEPVSDIVLSDESLDFGAIEIGTSSEKTLTISNLGGASLNISNVSLANNSDFQITSTDCDIVAPDANCSVTMTYTANSTDTSSDVLTIESNDPDQASVTVALSGSGKDPVDNTLEIFMNVEGTTYVSASDNSLPLSGSIDSILDLSTGMITADLMLNPTSGTFHISQLFRKLTATAHVEFEQLGQTTGSLVNGVLTANSQAYVKVPKVTVNIFGLPIPIGGGNDCRTMDPVTFSVATPDGEIFQPLEGGSLVGNYELPALENCGLLTSVLSQFLAGPGNTIDLDLTPQQ
ncbi:choice-of-anchor D domain-containing protein [Hahella ganghwensis]|uniref:choice-of-anchor D domain-containing protein n=1 Tax=Hahella ganghwensis TaxID=286420 RepID=UPI00039EA990|nr:choice-of-anchor D domain-containing protein [Hahella ganghwensis]